MDIQQIEEAAHRKIEQERNERIAAVREYVSAAKRSVDARAELAAAEDDHLAKYRAALRHGWTESDLKGFGIEPPSRKLGGRPRKARNVTVRPRNVERAVTESDGRNASDTSIAQS